jgi:hypothetical protein
MHSKAVFRELAGSLPFAVFLPERGCLWAFEQCKSMDLRSGMGVNAYIKKENISKVYKNHI